jgi:hypothetical protein
MTEVLIAFCDTWYQDQSNKALKGSRACLLCASEAQSFEHDQNTYSENMIGYSTVVG